MKTKYENGITLISLIVMIIIMLILASVVITLTFGNNGLINVTKQAKEETNKQTATEKINLKITNSQIKSYAKMQRMPTLQEIANDLCEDDEIQYVATKSKVAKLDKITVGSQDSIFTKLNDYPYEFEINSSLQLATIDGTPVGNKTSTNVLYEGKSTSETELVLSSDLSSYSYIEIYFNNIDQNSASANLKFDVQSIISTGNFDIYDFYGWAYYSTYTYDKDNNKFVNVRNAYFNHDYYNDNTSIKLKIYKIVGYK